MTESHHTQETKSSVAEAGSHRPTQNRLAGETSPYLRQHAHNPVDWYPWGPEALAKAAAEKRPIFLSIGYSTCYWCHVMEREVFENPAIAALMNEHFVNIKVDREERPDLDDIYMAAVQLTTGRGGWPMSVFLTPPKAAGEDDQGLAPFFTGTYFPPTASGGGGLASGGGGMPSFPQVILSLSEAWRTQRRQILEHGREIAGALRQHFGAKTEEEIPALSVRTVERAANQLLHAYEPVHGGFGGGPKFPQPSNLMLLLRIQQDTPQPELAKALGYTLERMARGGICDQIGGGFHRYSVDEKWLVPHFEKMLYDNAQLIEAYLWAQEVIPDAGEPGMFARVAGETAEYLRREMVGPDGGFHSAQDAEVNAYEGKNYLWQKQEITAALAGRAGGEELAELAIGLYGLEGGPNFRDPHQADALPANVLFLPRRLDEVAGERGLSLDQLLEKRRIINERLLAARAQRPQPRTDDKVIVSWNGMAIAAMAKAGRLLGEIRYTEAAERAGRTILEHLRQADGALWRTLRQETAKIPAFLEDYAFLTHGFIELYRATKHADWLRHARELMAKAVELFDATGGGFAGGYFDTLANQADLLVRVRATYDGAISSGNSQMIHNLLDLYEQTGEEEYLSRAGRDLRSFAGPLEQHGAGMIHMQFALLRALALGRDLFGKTTSPGRKGAGMELQTAAEAEAGKPGTFRMPLTILPS
ncbi:MAG: thioredoxin domain-containing protein [Phycisphaeraceae bacterium]|nr:thioredoxin domain-containing protein [Phycisphaeraceae bacterium]